MAVSFVSEVLAGSLGAVVSIGEGLAGLPEAVSSTGEGAAGALGVVLCNISCISMWALAARSALTRIT